MSTPQFLTLFAFMCLVMSALLARTHLCHRYGLRRVFIGLFTAAGAGVFISIVPSLTLARLLSIPMLIGMGLVVRGIYLEKKVTAHHAA